MANRPKNLPDREFTLALMCGFSGTDVEDNPDLENFSKVELMDITIKTDSFLKSLLKELDSREE